MNALTFEFSSTSFDPLWQGCLAAGESPVISRQFPHLEATGIQTISLDSISFSMGRLGSLHCLIA